MKILSAGFFLLISQSIQAEDLMQVYRKALLNDPQILGAQYTRAAADDSVKEVYGRMLPQVGFEYSRSDTNQNVTKTDNPFQPAGETDFPTTDYSLNLTQPLYNRVLYTGYQQTTGFDSAGRDQRDGWFARVGIRKTRGAAYRPTIIRSWRQAR